MGSEQNRFPQHQEAERRKRWGGCLSALSCFGTQKGGKRIVPASRIPEGNGSATQPNAHGHPHGALGHGHPHGPQPNGLPSQPTTLLAPPSSPASLTNSALPSTAQSPTNCFLSLSASSPGGPSSNMYATGPYAHETQLVSPPVFSTFTTEPSTAPLTPPPELAHLTTPSSPDVPFAHFLSSTGGSVGLKTSDKTNYIGANDLQATYSLYPGSPPTPSSLVSPQNGKCEHDHENAGAASAVASTQDSNFFCPATFAQFYLDNPPFPNSGGRLSVSKESDVYNSSSAAVNGVQNQNSRQMKSPKQDAEEIEAYRASFGFSADEIITTPQYVEISDVMEDSSFTRTPTEEVRPGSDYKRVHGGDSNIKKAGGEAMMISDEEEDILLSSKMRTHPMGMSSSDAEIDYRRGRSLRQKRFHMA